MFGPQSPKTPIDKARCEAAYVSVRDGISRQTALQNVARRKGHFNWSEFVESEVGHWRQKCIRLFDALITHARSSDVLRLLFRVERQDVHIHMETAEGGKSHKEVPSQRQALRIAVHQQFDFDMESAAEHSRTMTMDDGISQSVTLTRDEGEIRLDLTRPPPSIACQPAVNLLA